MLSSGSRRSEQQRSTCFWCCEPVHQLDPSAPRHHRLSLPIEYAAVSGVTIEGSEFGIWQTSSQVDRITAGHHSIVITVYYEDRLLNARQVGRLLTPPSMDSLELSTESREGNRLVAIVRTFLQSHHELS